MNSLYQKDKDIVIIRRASGNKEFEEYPLVVQPQSVLALDPSSNLFCLPVSSLLQSSVSASFAQTASFTNFAGTTIYATTAGTASWATTAIAAISSSGSLIAQQAVTATTASNAKTSSIAIIALGGTQFTTTQLTASSMTASSAVINQLTASNLFISNLSIQSSSFATTASYVSASNIGGIVPESQIADGTQAVLPTLTGKINLLGHSDGVNTIYESSITSDNLGNLYGNLVGTASVSTVATSASISTLAKTASYVATASYYPPQQFLPSGSWASASLSSSYAKNASTSSLALTASLWNGYVVPTLVTSSLTASYAVSALTSSNAITASAAITALGVLKFPTLAPGGVRVLGHTDGDGTIYESSVLVDGVGFIYGNLTGSAQNAQTATSSSYAKLADSASYYPPSAPSISSSYALLALTASNAVTASYSTRQLPDITNTAGHNIGINQTSPQYTLDLGGTPTIGASSGLLTISTVNNNLGNGISITADNLTGVPGGDGGHVTIEAGNGISTGVFGGDIILLPGTSVDTRQGGVGIFTTNPQYALDVSGSINFTGSLLQNGLPYTTSFAYTASYTLAVGSASYSTTASYVIAANSSVSSSYAVSSSYSPVADFATSAGTSVSSSYSSVASIAIVASSSISSSYSPVADFATTSSYAVSSSAATSIPQIVPDSLGFGGTCLILKAADTGTPLYLHISSSGQIQVTAWA